MEIRPASRLVEQFRAPKRTLGDLEADAAAKLITAASDVALVIDSKGIIRDVALGSEELVRDGFGDWVGQRWIDTVTSESREKIQEILAEAVSKALPRWRQVNHPTKLGGDVPVRYSAVQIGPSGRVYAIANDSLYGFAPPPCRTLRCRDDNQAPRPEAPVAPPVER